MLPVESYNRSKPRATFSYKWLKKSRLDMVDTCYHVKPCTFQIVSWNGLNIRFSRGLFENGFKTCTFLPFFCQMFWNTWFFEWLKPINMYIGEYFTKLFGIALLKRKFVTGWVIQSFKTESHCFVQTSEEVSLDMVDTWYHVKASYI